MKLSLVPPSTIETDRAIQTISAVPSHRQARANTVDLSTPDNPSPHEIYSELEVQAIEASNVEPIEMNFPTQNAEIPNVEPSDIHFGINTVAVFEDQVNQLPQQEVNVGTENLLLNLSVQTIFSLTEQGSTSRVVGSSSRSTSDLRNWAKEHFLMKDPSDELTDRERDAIHFLRNLKGESLSKEQELQAREAIYLLSTNPESSINQILDYARESLDLIPSIQDLFEQHQEEFDKLNEQTEGLQVERQGLANNAL